MRSLCRHLQRRIESGEYPSASLLPSGHQLIQEFGVSRPTVVALRCGCCVSRAGSNPSRARAASCAAIRRWPMPSAPGRGRRT
ncbi:GntR family transcriptional regulator [Nonomuraea sp. NPDC055795]